MTPTQIKIILIIRVAAALIRILQKKGVAVHKSDITDMAAAAGIEIPEVASDTPESNDLDTVLTAICGVFNK